MSPPHAKLSSDIWVELVGSTNQAWFLRPSEPGFPSSRYLRNWLSGRAANSTILVMNTQIDLSCPPVDWMPLLEHPALCRVFATNPRKLHPKIRPIPIGPKWQFASTHLYGEPKAALRQLYGKVASSASDTKRLFNKQKTLFNRDFGKI